MAMKRRVTVTVFLLTASVLLALLYAAAAEARPVLHSCPGGGEGTLITDSHPLHDPFCGAHTPTYTPTSTSTPTSTPTPLNTATATATATSRVVRANTATPTATGRSLPAGASTPTNGDLSEKAPTPTPTRRALPTTAPGPLLPSISQLAGSYSAFSPTVELYRGTNPLSGKAVHVDYLPSENAIRVSTYYADTPYSVDKPYIFTLDEGYQVTHQAW